MSKNKIDGVVEAVHYDLDGNVKWVRAYMRRGQTYTDRVKLDRPTLVGLIKSGKRVYAGQRIVLKASTFEITNQLQLIPNGDLEYLSTGEKTSGRDKLENIPVI